jgi:hypothetical protein
VRWASIDEQVRNRRSNVWLTHNGKTQTMADWAREIGLEITTIRTRIVRYGWTVERALSSPKIYGRPR